jgi:hypothetical protein
MNCTTRSSILFRVQAESQLCSSVTVPVQTPLLLSDCPELSSGVNVKTEEHPGYHTTRWKIGERATHQGQADNSLQPSHVRSLGSHSMHAMLGFVLGWLGWSVWTEKFISLLHVCSASSRQRCVCMHAKLGAGLAWSQSQTSLAQWYEATLEGHTHLLPVQPSAVKKIVFVFGISCYMFAE